LRRRWFQGWNVLKWARGTRPGSCRPATYGTQDVRMASGDIKLRFDDQWAPYVPQKTIGFRFPAAGGEQQSHPTGRERMVLPAN
jgi:hypothetical protein